MYREVSKLSNKYLYQGLLLSASSFMGGYIFRKYSNENILKINAPVSVPIPVVDTSKNNNLYQVYNGHQKDLEPHSEFLVLFRSANEQEQMKMMEDVLNDAFKKTLCFENIKGKYIIICKYGSDLVVIRMITMLMELWRSKPLDFSYKISVLNILVGNACSYSSSNVVNYILDKYEKDITKYYDGELCKNLLQNLIARSDSQHSENIIRLIDICVGNNILLVNVSGMYGQSVWRQIISKCDKSVVKHALDIAIKNNMELDTTVWYDYSLQTDDEIHLSNEFVDALICLAKRGDEFKDETEQLRDYCYRKKYISTGRVIKSGE